MNETDKSSDKKEKIDDATLVSDDQNIDTEIEENTNEEQIIKVNETVMKSFIKKLKMNYKKYRNSHWQRKKDDSKKYSKNKRND